jgi:quercetin dioxygenase-like cupin family protein
MKRIASTEARQTETPNATMTTLASPTLGGTEALSLWRVAMVAEARGPLHRFDSEQVWTVIRGAVEILGGEKPLKLGPGDSLVLEADAERQIVARTAAEMIVCGYGDARVTAIGESEDRGTPPWVA